MEERQKGMQTGLLAGTALMGGLVACALLVGRRAAQPLGGGSATLVVIPPLVGSLLAAALVYRAAASAFKSLQEREKELERLRAEFIQNVTHELRQPLTLVRGYVEMLAREQVDEETRQRLSDLALARTIDLMERVEAITTFHSLPRTPPKPELVDLADLTDTALKMVWQKAFRAGVTFCLERPPHPLHVMADPFWLLEALKQLLDNAIKFSPEGSFVSVRLLATEDEACVEVADQGIGIPATELDQVFVPFHQLDGSASRRFSGMGLGLAIAREIAEAHRGELRAISGGQNSGSTFVLALPLSRSREQNPSEDPVQPLRSITSCI